MRNKEITLAFGFDAFRNHADAEVVAHRYDTSHDALTHAVSVDAAEKSHIELDDVGLKIYQKRKSE